MKTGSCGPAGTQSEHVISAISRPDRGSPPGAKPGSTARSFSITGEISGALTAALLLLPSAIGYGLILAGPLASEQAAIAVALLGTIVGGAIMAALGGSGPLMLSASLPVSLLLAGALRLLPPDPGLALAHVALIVALTSAMLAGVAVTGLGKLLSRVPYPVLAGILNGTAILMLLSMRPYVVPVGWTAWGGMAVAACVAGMLLFVRMPRSLSSVPVVLLAMVAGTSLHYALSAVVGPGVIGPVLRALPGVDTAGTDWRLAVAGLRRMDWPSAMAVAVPAASSIAFIAVIETMTASSALHDVTGRAVGVRRMLLAVAASVLVGGAAGGMPLTGSLTGTMGAVKAGGLTRLAPVLRSAFLLCFVALLSSLPFQLPMAALAGVLVAAGVRMIDLAGLRLIWAALRRGPRNRGELLGNAAVIIVVTALAVCWSLMAAVVVGMALSLSVFALAMAQGVVRRSYPNAPGRSRTSRNATEAGILVAESGRITVLEIDGAVFFGSVEEITTHVEAAAAAGADFVVLDMRRVTRLDLSGARHLIRSIERMRADGLALTLAYVRPGLPVWDYLDQLDLLRRIDPAAVFASLDAALQAAEASMLRQHGGACDLCGTDPMATLRQLGLAEPTAASILSNATTIAVMPGTCVIRTGEQAREMFVLLHGQLDVVFVASSGTVPGARLVTITAGTVFGEMALMAGGTRSADVIARVRSTCLRLDAADVDLLKRDHPEAALDLLTAITRQMSRNLYLANMTIRSLED